MSRSSEVTLLVFSSVLLGPEEFELTRSITMNCDRSLMGSWSQKMPGLKGTLFKMHCCLVRLLQSTLHGRLGIFATNLQPKGRHLF